MEVGPGDYVKVDGCWECINLNTAFGENYTPREWTITTAEGGVYDMWNIDLYAKADDMVAAGGGNI